MNDDGALLLAIGRLEGKVDTLIQLQRIHEERLNSHDERLRLLEHSKASIYGAASVVAIVSSFLVTALFKFIPQGV